jgi:HAE1 family hydrophobic/amphiphilic exporter-1/multidrug efflux pump
MSDVSDDRLIAARNKLLELATKDKMLVQVRPSSLDDVPLLKVNVDQPRAGALGLNLADVNDTLLNRARWRLCQRLP